MGRALTEKERQFIRVYYPKYQAKETARRFNRKFGSNKTRESIQHSAGRMGLGGEVEPGFYTVTELAMLCGVERSSIIKGITKRNIEAKKKGKRYLIKETEADKVIKHYVQTPKWTAMPSIEAAKRLGYALSNTGKNAINRIAAEKGIPSYKFKGVLYVPLAYIEAAELQMMRTGRNWVSWQKIHEELGYE